MITHEIETKKPERRELSLGGDGELKWYRCLKGTDELPFEYCGHSLRKNDQINSSLPVCGKGVDLTKSHKVYISKEDFKDMKPQQRRRFSKDKDGEAFMEHPPSFELIIGMIPADTAPAVTDTDPRSKEDICKDIFLINEEKINPLRIGRPDLIAYEKKVIIERQKDAQTAVMDAKVM